MLLLSACAGYAQSLDKESFAMLNLDYPGMEQVKKMVNDGKYEQGAAQLLKYFRKKFDSRSPDFSNNEESIKLSDGKERSTIAIADSALKHIFKPNPAYGFYNFGKDIDWTYWPIKDNAFRWQLNRIRWWTSMALVYYDTNDERYAKEWMAQYLDWAVKNPLGKSADIDRFSWRSLEISHRIMIQIPMFQIFIKSPSFTPDFLMSFLKIYYSQANYLPQNFAPTGNIRLFGAQRSLLAGASFPEFKNAAQWRKIAIGILSEEIKKQVYEDGVQNELSPIYHVGTIETFLKGYRIAENGGFGNEFPLYYKPTIEKMIMAFANFSFPNYSAPMFGDAWFTAKSVRLRQYKSWLKDFPKNEAIRYFATDGKDGIAPAWLSKALPKAGFYTFRNAWRDPATVLVLKASPPAEFHAQPDNGTFELWVKGRNFMPDAGSYVYDGDSTIARLRSWYRQTRVHNTLTLNNQNMLITDAKLKKWNVGKESDILTYNNQSYKELNHQRSVIFVDKKYFLIIDQAIGAANGQLDVHFGLKEDSSPVYDYKGNRVYTTYTDGNNLLIQNLNSDKVTMIKEDGKVSYAYRKEIARPLFAFEKQKANALTETFIHVLYPYQGSVPPTITLQELPGNDIKNGKLNIDVTINGKKNNVKQDL